MATILEKANQILTEKNEVILPENIKAGIQVFDINGTFTADANAVAEDLLAGKTAYVNGELISGTISSISGSVFEVNSVAGVDATTEVVYLTGTNTEGKSYYFIYGEDNMSASIPQEILAEAIGLTADKIIVGNTILGIAGAAVKGDDLEAQLQAQDELIATQQAQIEELTAMLNDRASNITTETIDNVNDILGEEV